VVGEDAERGREAPGFAPPVLHERGRADHEAGSVFGSLSAHRLEEGEGLDRLTEAHFIGEQSAECIVVKVPKPSDPDLLVESEHLSEFGTKWCGLEPREVANGGRALGPGLGRSEGSLDLLSDGIGARELGVAHFQVEIEVDLFAIGVAGVAEDASLSALDGVEKLWRDEARTARRVEEHAATSEGFLHRLG